jgi:hypothetical protein
MFHIPYISLLTEHSSLIDVRAINIPLLSELNFRSDTVFTLTYHLHVTFALDLPAVVGLDPL